LSTAPSAIRRSTHAINWWDGVEVSFQIRIVDGCQTIPQAFLHGVQRIVRCTAGAKAVGDGQKVRLEEPHRLRTIAFPLQVVVQVFHKPLDTSGGVLDVLNPNPIHPRCTVVRNHLVPRRRKHVWPQNPVIQRIESKPRLLLRFDVQSLPQLEDRLWQTPFVDLKRQR